MKKSDFVNEIKVLGFRPLSNNLFEEPYKGLFVKITSNKAEIRKINNTEDCLLFKDNGIEIDCEYEVIGNITFTT